MIKNEREYRVTRTQAARFEQALAELSSGSSEEGLHPLLEKAQRDSLQSQMDELREQIAEYEALRSGTRTVISLDSLEELPQALIQARIAAGLSQAQLADRLGLKEQQVQRYEATDYAAANLARLSQVIHALDVHVREDVFLSGTTEALEGIFGRLRDLVSETVAANRSRLARS
ncbi:MAG TPA: helix-turn-helix transcriptional regulator [Thermoanaerobaculia bacterium]|jgi:transcriptional regulator with XRE-family HTH domain|nr:helix-turn-helix transcriptional regulator [Thermoanaerobaculia bacterium]